MKDVRRQLNRNSASPRIAPPQQEVYSRRIRTLTNSHQDQVIVQNDVATFEGAFISTFLFANTSEQVIPDPERLVPTNVLRHLAAHVRSEEHTSELQSRPHLVCRLLLEK